jgi:esterase/lipase superfamily enzyme
MGNWALQAAVESWFTHGNGASALFDEVFLAAADERYDSFSFTPPGRLSNLDRLAKRISTYYSTSDDVLAISMVVNLGAKRLGQEGPHDRFDTTLFPPATYRTVDCSTFQDYDFNPASSHQYYRRSLVARTDIADTMA